MHGQQLLGQFSLGSEAAREGVVDCIIYGDGIVALTGQLHLILLPASHPNFASSAAQLLW